ncbi:hypothetical protein QFZ79_002898 [Arthrobacter sp. V4I6]|uniref:hypothetical protein n=1 Tax=Arthrobacter sp. V4I6 TaxID=3042281 RepID=UPI00277FDBB2|nr:hypothetical protein [Arthrobacter sp. V4I6]MDQ0854787.1 hypothetical protein [Arthrobacter sp. V4I6]
MSTASAETPETPAGAPAEPPATVPPVEPPAATEPPKASEWDGKVESLPADAQKIIAGLRKEAGDERVAAKTLAAIQKALNPEAGDEKPDPVKLAALLSERDTEAKQAKTELAVYKAAAKAGADADALLDSRAFLAKIADLDPSKTADIDKAIKEAVTNNPKLKTVQAAGASGSDFSGGSGEGAVTQAAFNAMSPAEKNALYKTNPAAYRKLTGR